MFDHISNIGLLVITEPLLGLVKVAGIVVVIENLCHFPSAILTLHVEASQWFEKYESLNPNTISAFWFIL